MLRYAEKTSSPAGFSLVGSYGRGTSTASAKASGSGVRYRAQRNPRFGSRESGGAFSGSMYMYTGSFHAPPSTQRRSPAAFQHHSATLPAMSYVPKRPTPGELPTDAGPSPRK